MKSLRKFIRAILLEDDSKKDLLTEPDENEKRDEKSADEYSGATAVAGYTLPLGASNSPTTLRQRGEVAGTGFGGAKPEKKKRKKKSKKAKS